MTDEAKREYDTLAPEYDRRWRHYVDSSVRRTLAALEFKGDERVLDVGCGTGALFRELLKTHDGLELHGVDPSAEMLDVARRKCGTEVVLEVVSAETLPYPENHFDVVTSLSALHYFSDPRKAFSEMGRVLSPGGTVAVTDWCADFAAMRIFAGWLRLRKAALGRVYRVAELTGLLEETGFEIERTERFRIAPLWGMMVVTGARRFTETTPELREKKVEPK